ncbi:MAG: hypothetical protein ACRD0K_30230, partial [Egibacteraceae bacterium]
ADTLLALRERPMAQTERTRLEAVAVGSCAQAGLLAFFAGDRAVAGRCFALARTTAKDSGDATLHGQALVAASVLYSPIPTGGRGGDSRRAVALLTEGVQCLGHAAPEVRAWAYRWLGMELAAAGKERGFHQVMEIAGRLADQAGQQDPRGFFARYVADLNRNSAGRDNGVGYVLLGRADQAVAALSPVRMVGSLQRWASRLSDIAAARVLQGEPEQACALLGEALDLTLDNGRWMGVERILGVRARFPQGKWDDLPCVRELDERLRHLTGP